MKNFTKGAMLAATVAMGIGLSACDSKSENAQEAAAQDVREASEAAADKMEDKADVVREAGDTKADAMEDSADKKDAAPE